LCDEKRNRRKMVEDQKIFDRCMKKVDSREREKKDERRN
jgi:hypothetical protein